MAAITSSGLPDRGVGTRWRSLIGSPISLSTMALIPVPPISTTSVLIGKVALRDALQSYDDTGLEVLACGPIPPNPSELLASERMETLLTNLSHGPFDWIIIDTPPVLAVTDAVILAPLVSGVTFVIGADMTRRRLAERAIETLVQTRPKYAAAVLNKVDFARNKYYYSRYYGHQYNSYYSDAAV